jgi:hypothetical protein
MKPPESITPGGFKRQIHQGASHQSAIIRDHQPGSWA